MKEKVPNLQHVIVVGEEEEFVNINDLYMDPVSLPEVQPSDVAFLQLSGGTTGLSKLIPRTHDDYIYSLRVSAKICNLNAESVYMAVLPAAQLPNEFSRDIWNFLCGWKSGIGNWW